MNLVKFKQWECEVMRHQYGNGRTALQLVDAANGEPIATATVNVPAERLAPGEVIIKDYSENEGMVESLVAAKIVTPASRRVQLGRWASAAVCTLCEGVD